MKKFTFLLSIFFVCYFANSQVNIPYYNYGSKEFIEIEKIYDIRLLRQSEIRLMQLIKEYPFTAAYDKAILLQSDIDLHSGNHSIAIAQINEYIKTNSNSPLIPHSYLKIGFIEFERKRYSDAVKCFEFAKNAADLNFRLRRDSVYKYIAHQALYWNGIALANQGKHFDAATIFEELVKNYEYGEFTDDAIYSIGSIYEMNNDYKKAIEAYKLLQSKYPYRNTIIASYIREANNHLMLRDNRSALLAIERAETINRIIIAAKDDAKKFEKQTNIDAYQEKIIYLRAEAFNLSKNYDAAIASYNQLVESYPNSYLIYNAKLGAGWASLNQYNYDFAIKYFDAIIINIENNNDINKSLAQLYRSISLKEKGDTANARKELYALSLNANYRFLGNVLLELGQMNYESGDYVQARKDLERASREVLDGRTAIRVSLLLGATYLELKLYDKAYNEYKQAEQLALNSDEIFVQNKKTYINEARLKQGIALVLSLRSSEAIKPLLSYISDNEKSNNIDEAYFWLAEAYYRSDLLNNSAQIYRKIIDEYPLSRRREEALYGLGWSHFRLKNFEQSSRIFDQLVKEFPKSDYAVEVLTRQGDGYYLNKNYSKAAEAYQKAFRLAPNSEEGQYSAYQLAHAYYRMQRFEQAITALLEFANRYTNSPYSPNALYLIGWIRFQQKRYAEAIDNFNFMIKAYPQSNLVPRAYYAIADCYYNMGNFEEAIKGYQYIIQTFPSNELASEAMRSVQFALMAMGREDEAIKIADKYIESNPESPYIQEFKYKRAEMFYTGRRFNDAVSEFENFINKYPDNEKNAEAMFLMGKSYISMNEFKKASETFEKLVKQYPKSDYAPLGLLEYGLLQKQINNPLKADTIFSLLETSYNTHETAAQAGFERALIRLLLLDTLGAVNKLKSVADNFPHTEYGDFSRYRVAMYYRTKLMFDSALVHFRILSKEEGNPSFASEAQYRLGEIYMRMNDCEKAIDEFIIVKENFTGYEDWFSLSLLNLGECYERLNRLELAREMYQILENLRPDDDFGKTAKSRLRRIKQ
jgi:TolA-binding protein